MKKIIKYFHHGEQVSVFKKLKGKHKKHCLCYKCKHFCPGDTQANCPIAQQNFEMDVKFCIVTPVWECMCFLDRRFAEIEVHEIAKTPGTRENMLGNNNRIFSYLMQKIREDLRMVGGTD